jgi:two-component system NtrC family sensor kinase
MVLDKLRGRLYTAATTSFDFNNYSQAISDLLQMTSELLQSEKVALYEYVDSEKNFIPRHAIGIPLQDLGRLSFSADHPLLRKVLSSQRAGSTEKGESAISLPLAPGAIACAPCITGDQTVGLFFAGSDNRDFFDEESLAILEVLATRGAEALVLARQSADQSYIFHKLSLLYEASHAITGTRDQQEAIRLTAAHLLKATSADICETLIFEEGNGQTTRFLQTVDQSMQQSVTVSSADPMPDYPAHKQVINELRPVTLSLSPPAGSSKDIAILQSEGISAVAIFPLATRQQALGIVRLIYTEPGRQISDQEMELAQAILNIGAIGFLDAVHFEAAESRADQLQVLGEIGREMTSTLDLESALENAMIHIQRMLKTEACVLFLLDDRGDKLVLKATGGRHMRIRDVAIRLEEGIAGWVTRNRRPLIVNDVRTNPLYHSAIDGQTGLLTNSVLCVPLAHRDVALGVIEAINHPNGTFTEIDQQLLMSVAAWAAVALENANLFQRVTEERTRLETTLVETADAVILTDIAGRIILVNQAAGQAFRIDPENARDRLATEVFPDHPLGDLLMDQEISLPVSQEVTTPADRTLFATISEITNVGRVAVMQDITALKQIDRMRSQLLGTAAHDLKNPLNAIRLGADLLHDAKLSEPQRKALNMMHRATDSMTNLITALLETIRVESTTNIISEPCQINDLIRHAIEDLRPLAEAKEHKILYKPPPEALLVSGDPSRLNSVMSNLLSNAVKFTQHGGKITISTDYDDDIVIIGVQDNGPGIPKEEIPRVFDHLFRGRITVQDPDNPIEGTGLGLALAKTVIEQHGGRIWVESEESQGSTFLFSLPREPTPQTGSFSKKKK